MEMGGKGKEGKRGEKREGNGKGKDKEGGEENLKGQGREGQGNKRDGKGRVEGKERKRGGEKG